MLDNEGYEITFRQWCRQRRIEKRMKRIESGEPDVRALILTRFLECLFAEGIISVVASALMVLGIVPQTQGPILILLGIGLLGYFLFMLLTCHSIFRAVMNVNTYLKINLGGYGVFIILSVLLRCILSTPAFSWVFMPFKIFVFVGMSLEVSLIICHLLMASVIFGTIVNMKVRGMDEEY